MVRLTPLGLYGLRARLLEAGFDAPAVGDLADKGADALLDGTARLPRAAARAETEQWLARREPLAAARELLAAARGADAGAPLRRLRCQQALSCVGGQAEPAVREVLDDAELGGLARVWLDRARRDRRARAVRGPWSSGSPSTPWPRSSPPRATPRSSRPWSKGWPGSTAASSTAAWRVDHPATADVLEAMGRLHPDKRIAKEARKAAFKARSQQGG